ncbi:MAG TPA: GNAT family N-acetyltransferase [Candidatus Methanofastidiosa archaeon]|nr:GNAT family N-acetyltransferase [Candidatus Methanofastidiosa archaeon]HPR42064.1 GNAT family N-acetyltransferase [Candidatus Methanofastidiosa archaeon]
MSPTRYELLESINDINRNQWNNVVETSRYSSFFQSHEWQRLIEEGIGLEPRHIVASRGDNITSIFPNYFRPIGNSPFKRLYSIRPGYGGHIILSSDEKGVLDSMYNYIPKLCCGNAVSHYIVTYDLNYTRYGEYMRRMGYEPRLECRFVIDLDQSLDTILGNMSHQKRRIVNRCGDVEVVERKIGKSELQDFHMHHTKLMGQVKGEAYPQAFFTKMEDIIPDNVKIFEAVCNGNSAGQIMFFLDPLQKTVHKFFSGIEKECLKSNPTDAIVWHTLQWAKDNGYRYYDFGPTGDDFCNGVFRHKSGFGGQILPMVMWERVFSKKRWRFVDLMKRIHYR